MADLDKRYQVFVSSTYRDLREEREEIIKALLELDCIPSGMELFPASDEESWELIRRVIDDCDYYIVVVAGRYGSVDEEGVSYTEREYDYAISEHKPVLSFLHSEPEKIELGKSERGPEEAERLAAFREKAEQKMCKYWNSAAELGGMVSRSLVQQIKLNPGVGWVRGSQAVTAEVLDELTQLRTLNAELQAELDRSEAEPPLEAADLASGDEEVLLDIVVKTSYGRVHMTGTHEYTWNTIVAAVGPLMFDEASEGSLKRRMADELARDVPRAHPEQFDDFRPGAIELTDAAFHAIKVQLAALGVIEKSIQRRAVSDRNTYWRLTSYGEALVFQLSAIKKGQTVPAWREAPQPPAETASGSRRRLGSAPGAKQEARCGRAGRCAMRDSHHAPS